MVSFEKTNIVINDFVQFALILQMPSYAMQFKKKDILQHINAKCHIFFSVLVLTNAILYSESIYLMQ